MGNEMAPRTPRCEPNAPPLAAADAEFGCSFSYFAAVTMISTLMVPFGTLTIAASTHARVGLFAGSSHGAQTLFW